MTHIMRGLGLAASVALVAACSNNKVDEDPIIEQGSRVQDPAVTARAASAGASSDREETRAERDNIAAEAAAECAPRICEALARGEVALGMSEAQVMASTGTTPSAWTVRQAGSSTVMMPASSLEPPEDAVGALAMVQLADGRVHRYGYREAQGVRVVSDPADATTEGRAAALGDMLVTEGDELAAAGDLDRALDRYDRASILLPANPLVDYRIATVLDKQLRPIQALLQFKLFLHRLEIERIRAIGEAAGNLAHAIAHAEQRIIVLEKQGE